MQGAGRMETFDGNEKTRHFSFITKPGRPSEGEALSMDHLGSSIRTFHEGNEMKSRRQRFRSIVLYSLLLVLFLTLILGLIILFSSK